MTDQLPEGRDLYTIPSHSSWFHWDEIHETEKRSLREFFDSSSSSQNPRIYKEYRDFIINKYREDPSRRLTFTEIRKSLVGDVGALHKVFLFLQRWGLINFSASARVSLAPAPSEDGCGPVVVEEGPPSGVKVVPFPSSAKPLSSPLPPSEVKSGGKVEGLGFRLPPLTSYSDVFGSPTGPVCSVCGERCGSGYYESEKGGYVYCSKCFENENCTERKLAAGFKSNDQNDHNGKDEWTDSETLSLLEAVLKGNNDWNLVADHVRRSRHDCIARLIQLPFGEHMLGSFNGKFDGRNPINHRTDEPMQRASTDLALEPMKTDTQEHVDSQKREQIAEEEDLRHSSKWRCFALLADASDSLMEQVAHLATIAGPRVAAASAEAAVAALCHENPYARKVFQIDTDERDSASFSLLSNTKPERDQMFADQETAEQLKVADISESKPEKNFGHLTFQIRAATATAFGAVAGHAKLLADQEDREIEHLMASAIEFQLRKILLKIKHFEELEAIMEVEYARIQQMKESILTEWIGILQKAQSAGIPRWRDLSFSKPSDG